MKRTALTFAALAILAGGSAYYAVHRAASRPTTEEPTTGDRADGPKPPERGPELPPATVVAEAIPAPSNPVEEAKTFPFGTGPGALGRGEGKRGPIGPKSLIATANGNILLDQENERIVTTDGRSIPLPYGKHADDIAQGPDGSMAVLDSAHSKEISLLNKDGSLRGKLPLAGVGMEDGLDATRVFVEADGVYVERNGGGPLLKIGTADGKPATERTELLGIPTRDGKSLLSAGITDEEAGRAWVTLADLKGVHRWTREFRFPAELSAVGFVDSETSGTLWVVLLAGSSPADFMNWAVCLDPLGNVRGKFALSVEDPPWESFRDFSVRPEGGIVVVHRGNEGVSYSTYNCP